MDRWVVWNKRTKKDLEKKLKEIETYKANFDFWSSERKKELDHTRDLVQLLKEARVASDVAFNHDRSWAIVCLGGKKELVHFYQFPDNDVRVIDDFLRHFSRESRKNSIVDAPYGVEIYSKRKPF